MIEMLPSILLVAMIMLTLALLPYLNEERPPPGERSGLTDELHICRHDQQDLRREG